MAKTDKRKKTARLPAQIDRAIAAAEDKKALDLVVLDLRDLGFVDGAGVHVVLDAADRAQLIGQRVVVLCGPVVERVLTLVGAAELEIETVGSLALARRMRDARTEHAPG